MATSVKVGPWGGRGGTPRDISDNSKPQRLESITIRSSDSYGGRIYNMSFEYVDQKNQTITFALGSNKTKGSEDTITMGPGEYVNLVSGTTDGMGVTSLKFETSTEMVYGPYGCATTGNEFSLPLDQDDGKVVGFFGRCGDSVVALGAYVLTGNATSSVKVGPWGGSDATATPRDIPRYNVPRRLQTMTIYSSEASGRIYGISFVYEDQTGQSISVGPWGSTSKGSPNSITMVEKEYVHSISGTTDSTGLTSLAIETTKKGKHAYGRASGTAFSLPMQQGNGAALSLFGLTTGDFIVALGVYLGQRL